MLYGGKVIPQPQKQNLLRQIRIAFDHKTRKSLVAPHLEKLFSNHQKARLNNNESQITHEVDNFRIRKQWAIHKAPPFVSYQPIRFEYENVWVYGIDHLTIRVSLFATV